MPTYGYRCTACAHEFEVFQKMSDPPIATCEVCGAPVKKRLYPVGISFKGSGFYVNDYNKSAKSEGSDSAPGSDAKPAESSASTTEAKPADSKPAATETKPAAPASTPPSTTT